ncbi:HPr family phosphocarrier protein [Nakamurella sp. YIM 132087]|uniref:phosphoenolpyruvate--glycerone phosphotransferase n=1 Tax=Nakamurella alba TaxID=2665158 RepID=A0A7K1FGV9_9ACTN|nr:dihydroxyacetone kinase phosphoryl donor subunit DhaM [Nakamurella alba]MTD13306.1 HPr family phosphocarrier protein [Nakamurella alba]
MSVGLIVVSHSRALAEGTAALARQMAPSVTIAEAGGTEDGSIGTSFDAIMAAIATADSGDGAVLLYDLGSALLTAETALEFSDPEAAERIRIVDAPLVEGAVAAAVAAESGAGLDGVAEAAGRSGGSWATVEPAQVAVGDGPQAGRSVLVVNPLGLHARPVAALVRALDGWDAVVTVARPGGTPVDLHAVLRVVALALRGGETVDLAATGPDAVPVLDVLAGLITGGFGEVGTGVRLVPSSMGAAPARLGAAPANRPAVAARIDDGVLTAVPGSPGLAVGRLVRLDRAPVQVTGAAGRGTDADAAAEAITLLAAAIAAAGRKLAAGNQFQVAHAALLADPELSAAAGRRITEDHLDAAAAWWSVIAARAEELAADPDELVASRGADVREAGAAVLTELGLDVDRIPASLDGAIIVADDLGPGEVPVLVERGAAGVVLARSSITAHAVIVARGLGLPMVLRAGDLLARRPAGTVLVLDGAVGTVQVDPSAEVADAARARITALADERAALTALAAAPVVLPDGREIAVVANVGSLADARAAVANGADGVGLLRTELLLLDRDTFPDEDTHCADVRAILEVLGDRPVVVRLLDAGGDKPVTALALDPVQHGFLGVRGLRYLLAHPDLLQLQLRAVLRASVGHRVSVMAPMVSVAAEVHALRAAVDRAVASLDAEGVAFAAPEQVGVMIEVPAAALAADEICAVADFVSVGSNDLTGYLMAADRTNPEVADLLDPHGTALQRLLDQLCAQANAAGTPIAVCGEIAGMVDQVPGLVARGVHELSVAPARIPEVKQVLRALPV